jgi:galacturan 1,4-alpha-galacturonidase
LSDHGSHQTIHSDPNYVEGSCITDPCWYAVSNATGHEVIIYDLYPDTASNIVAKSIEASTTTGAEVAVMCDPDAVSDFAHSHLRGKPLS